MRELLKLFLCLLYYFFVQGRHFETKKVRLNHSQLLCSISIICLQKLREAIQRKHIIVVQSHIDRTSFPTHRNSFFYKYNEKEKNYSIYIRYCYFIVKTKYIGVKKHTKYLYVYIFLY